MRKGRRAYAQVIYDGKDITNELDKSLLSLVYTDNTDKADDIQIIVEDREGNWRGPWYPKTAAKKD